MKPKDEILKAAAAFSEPPKDYSLIEMHCFLALKQLTVMFYNNQIEVSNAKRVKQRIFAEYEEYGKMFEFKNKIYDDFIKTLKITSPMRIKLHKLLRDKKEICETAEVCMEIIKTVFSGEFTEWN